MLKTGHRTKYHLRAFEFLAARRRSRAVLTCTLLASFLATMPTGGLQAGDILRGGASAGNAKRNSEARANAGAAAAKVRAQDRLARTTKAVNDMRALQASARAAAGANTIPNGLTEGGLKVLTGANAKWEGANAPIASGNTVGITQTASQALLHWETFNVGSQTTVNFDQSAGGADSGKWIAFNKVFDPTAKPSEIRGKITSQGQVYILNQNGIIFGAGSQVNARTLVASALPINDNLVKNGLLNNKDAQFLFSALEVPGGSDGTPTFTPTDVPEVLGDIILERGAKISSPELAGGNGGRVMLIGANVRNKGEISTPAGQTILAAGLQVGVREHNNSDPSLRGLDVWVGAVDLDGVNPYAGQVQNSGIIESPTGSIVVAGKRIDQNGVLESTTSVNLNGRIDLLANYGAVANPNFDNSGTLGDGAPMFINQFTGNIVMGPQSITRILPDYASTKSVPGTRLPQNSQINFQGNSISFSAGSTLLAPSGDVGIRSGTWSYKDDESLNRTIFNADGEIEETLQSALRTPFIFTQGTVNFSSGAILDVSGTPDVFVPLSHRVMDVQLRGNELADSPLQRDSDLRGKNLRIDLRKTGVYGGRFWMGTPLGDANGLANIIERNAAQLTTRGGTVSIQAGESVAVASGAELNVSGGYTRNEGGLIQTTRLLRNGSLINIADATPDIIYDGILTGSSQKVSAKWGNPKTYRHALAPMGAYSEKEYIAGESGGSIDITAPTVRISGELSGRTVTGLKQLNTPAGHSSLALRFRNQKPVETPTGTVYLDQISAPPALVLGTGSGVGIPGLKMGQTLTIPSSILEEEEGFGHVTLENKGGTIQVAGEPVQMAAGGSLTLQATNVSILSSVLIPGGSLSATAYNYSPFLYAEQTATEVLVGQPAPKVVERTGIILIGSGVELNVAGTISDDRPTSALAHNSRRAIDGGSVKLEGFSIFAGSETAVRASGGVAMNGRGKYTKGKGGSISLLAGKDPLLSTSVGGTLGLPSILEAYSSSTGGSLTLQAMRARLGATTDRGGTTLDLSPGFFQKGGFSNFSIRAIGQPGSDEPALYVLPGTTIEPITESVVVRPHVLNSGLGLVKMQLPEGIRSAAGLSLTALGVDDPFTDEEVEAIGSIVLGAGAKIKTDIGGAVSLKGQTVSVFGSIETPAGSISIEGGSRFPLAAQQAASSTSALTTVYIAPTARLLARGATREIPDSFGRKMGEVLGGGSIRLAGNIVAESGAVLDVSGISNELDIHPSSLNTAHRPSPRHGLVTKPWGQQSVRVGVDSNGGTIRLLGSQLLLSDATLLGKSGGSTAVGGLLVVSSDAFNLQSGADITLSVQQSGNLIGSENTNLGVGSSVLDSEGSKITGGGFFAIDRFKSGGFAALDLGYEYFASATIPHGGNVKFIGPLNIQADGYVRVASGGIVQTDDQVSISAPYIAIGQEFRPPLHPSETFSPFNDANGKLSVTPTTGPGSLSLRASHVDVGTLVTMDTGSLHITANNGDIRGSGTLSVAGSITLESAQVYPTTLGKFDIFAYDTEGSPGSVTITQSGLAGVPLSAGGNLRIFASNISQGGTLRAPFGSITLGWDGSDLNTATEDIEGPVNQVAGLETATPVSSEINLLAGSTTSVSAIDPATGQGVVIPFGISPDGNIWVDPRGVNVTSSGMPEKTIAISGQGINQEAGSIIDLRGGGDLMAYRWVSGTGGSVDILGSPVAWNSGTDYSAGDLVSHNGRQYSARMALSPRDFNGSVPTPGRTAYWVEVPESFAVIPGFKSPLAPYAHFNSSDYASSLGGDNGYTSSLKIGDKITLDGGYGLPAGSYTLLPRRYALLPGARLVTPTSSKSAGFVNAEGAAHASGYRSNFFTKPDQATPIRSSYEILSPEVLANRAEYAVYSANDFIPKAATSARLNVNQALPMDSGSLSIHGASSLSLLGHVETASAGGIGAAIDISSFEITIGNYNPFAPSEVFLYASVLNSWKAESLLIGGQRSKNALGTILNVKTDSLLLHGAVLEGGDIILAAKNGLRISDGASIQSKNPSSVQRDLTTQGSSAYVRVDSNKLSMINRIGAVDENAASLIIGDNVSLSGASISMDSSRRASISEAVAINSSRISIGSGSLLLDLGGTALGDADTLRLGTSVLNQLSQADSISLKAYSSFTIAGSGTLGSENLANLSLESSGILGKGGNVVIKAKNLLLSNPNSVAAPAETSSAGQISFQSNHLRLGKGDFTVAGYNLAQFEASKGTIIANSGALLGSGELNLLTPTIASTRLSDYLIESDGALNINSSKGAGDVASELGAKLSLVGSSVIIGSRISLPSGELNIRAKSGDVTINSALSVAGSSRTFYDVVKFADAGGIRITSDRGNILLAEGSSLSVKGDNAGGRAGTLEIAASAGSFINQGTLLGQAATGFEGGSFILDVGTTGDFAEINTPLEEGGFNNLRNLRIRSGDVLLDQKVTSREFRLSTDGGDITVSAEIDASGKTGSTISLEASGSITLAESALLSVEGENFNSAGKGGLVELFTGSQINGVIDTSARLSIQSDSQILFGVNDYVSGGYLDAGSSASLGKFQGRLHLRAPRSDGNTDLLIDPLAGTIEGASAIIVEGYRLFDRTTQDGVMNIALRDAIHTDAQAFMTNESAIQSRLLGGSTDNLSAHTVVAPGFEIINTAGDLTLGLANREGTDNIEGKSAADWDLSAMRYGSKNAPGLLTLRASGDIVFNNSLSDGFVSVQPGAEDPSIYTNNLSFEENGHSRLWLAQLQTINSNLPTNFQSWSYTITAGSDLASANTKSILSRDLLEEGKGSVLVGEFYPAVANANNPDTNPDAPQVDAGVGQYGTTANHLRINLTETDEGTYDEEGNVITEGTGLLKDMGTRYEIVRTGTGDIEVNAGRHVQLRNQFATIYTAGVAIPDATRVIADGDFSTPIVAFDPTSHPEQGSMGRPSQAFTPQWAMAGGDLRIFAGNDIARVTQFTDSEGKISIIPDSSHQFTSNWLYRRGHVDTTTGKFGAIQFQDSNGETIVDSSASTAWWIDYSNFFQGFGTLGGGDIALVAKNDIVNADAVSPTNARMAGIGGEENLAADLANLVEFGGGDLKIEAGRNIDGGLYYAERGQGILQAGGKVKTNAARSPSLGLLGALGAYSESLLTSTEPEIFLPETWLPTALFVGKGSFEVSAKQDILLGPIANAFLMPTGLGNKFWYKSYFSTFSPESTVDVKSLGGDVTFRSATILPLEFGAKPILTSWIQQQNLFNVEGADIYSSNSQPWTRLSESTLEGFGSVMNLIPPTLKVGAFAGSVNTVGSVILAPASRGNLEIVAAEAVNGLQPAGKTEFQDEAGNLYSLMGWISSTINLSDANPAAIPGTTAPLSYYGYAGESGVLYESSANFLANIDKALGETGSYAGNDAAIDLKRLRHGDSLLHAGDTEPVRVYTGNGDISGLALFAPKFSRITSGGSISDVAFYLQNLNAKDISIVSATGDIIPYNEAATLRTEASNILAGNVVLDAPRITANNKAVTALAGDIQISGPGFLEVLAGVNLDLGTGENLADGTGTGIVSIGNSRNPNLPFEGASIIALAGIGAAEGGPALGLKGSNLVFENLEAIAPSGSLVETLSEDPEHIAIAGLQTLFSIIAATGEAYPETSSYEPALEAVETVFARLDGPGDIFTRSRDIRTVSGGSVALAAPRGGLTMASDIFGNPLTPPGVVTEFGGGVSILTDGDVDIGRARIFTLRGGDMTIWSTTGDIAAGTSPKTVVTAPPTRVVIDSPSADVKTDLGGLATGGGIGVLAAVEDVEPGNVYLLAPKGTVDAGDAGIQSTGNLNIAAVSVINADNISTGGTSAGVPSSAPAAAAPISVSPSASSSTAASSSAAQSMANQAQPHPETTEEQPSLITVEVLGYGGGDAEEEKEEG